MNSFTSSIVTIFTLLIGVAIIAALISPKAQTATVIQSLFGGFANVLGAAVKPVS